MKYTILLSIAAACLLSAGRLAAQDTTATLTLYTGDCYVWHAKTWDEADIDQALFAGDSLRTGRDSRAELGFSDGTSIRLDQNTKFFIAQNTEQRSFKLLLGKLWAKVAKLTEKATFEVESPTAVAGVRGTVFKVEVDADSTSRVAVEEGTVEVANPRLRIRLIRLAALQQSFVRRHREPTAAQAFDPNREPRWERLTRKLFTNLAQSARSLLTGLARCADDEQTLLAEARSAKQQLDAPAEPGAKLVKRIDGLQRRALDHRRKFRLLQLRAERRFRQVRILAGRIDEPAEQGQPADRAAQQAEAEALRGELDRLAARFEGDDAQVMPLLDQMNDAVDQSPQGRSLKADDIMARLARLEARCAKAQAALGPIASRLDQVEPALAAGLQTITRIRTLAASDPATARVQLAEFRRDYTALKQASGGFEFGGLDNLWLDARAAGSEARRLAISWPKDDPRGATVQESLARIRNAVKAVADGWQRGRRVQRLSQAVERLLFEAAALLQASR